MQCTRPVPERCKTGPIDVVYRPCGVCPACKQNKSRDWAYRLYCEQRLHEKSVFVTLTYDDEHIERLKLSPRGLYSLDKAELQGFMKRLRGNYGKPLRYYGIGEYGGKSCRPHYHLIVFGLGEEDLRVIQKSWEFGFVYVGSVTPRSVSYVARYCTKKIFKDSLDYEAECILPEFSLQSLKPGIGFGAIDKAIRRTKDGRYFGWFNGSRIRVPRYFLEKIRTDLERLKGRRFAVDSEDKIVQAYEESGKDRFAEQMQAERNVISKRSNRKKL